MSDEKGRQERSRDRRDLERWLAAEAGDRQAEAEAALATLFARVERLEPSPGFAARVLAGLAADRRDRRRAAPAAEVRPSARLVRAWRPRLGWSLGTVLAAAVAAWLLVPAIGALFAGPATRVVSVADLLDGIGRGLDWAARALAGLGDLWGLLSGLAEAIATATGTLPVATLLLVGLGVAGLALRALSDLIARERSWSHVHFGG